MKPTAANENRTTYTLEETKMRFMTELEAAARMAEARIRAAQLRERREQEERPCLVAPHRYSDGRVIL